MLRRTPSPNDADIAQAKSRTLTALFAAATLLVLVSIAARPISHDEGQYVSAIALMRHGWPYLDFAYLQTPLQPLLLSPLAALPAGWLLVAARAANGLFALVTLAILAAALKPLVRPANLLIALGGLACCDPFLLAGSLARNDALPMFLEAAALLTLLRAIERNRLAALLAAGALFGLAISTKINAALPAAGAGLFLVLRVRKYGVHPIAGFGCGILLGLLPSFAMAVAAPAQFRFGVFDYNLDAPRQWWTSIGEAYRLNPAYRVMSLIGFAAFGPSLVALAAAALDRRRTENRLLLDLMIIFGLIGSYMPEPAFPQYLVPLLVPLFARLALSLDALAGPSRRALVGLTLAFALVGLVPTIRNAAQSLTADSELARAVRQGRAVALLARGGSVVTLSPERVAGADVRLDPRFATGRFLYRTFGSLGDDALRYGLSPNWQRATAALDAAPPAVIMVGGESKSRPPVHPQGLDHPLVSWALAHGYRPVELPEGFRAFRRPAS
jgi:hypothetical protein